MISVELLDGGGGYTVPLGAEVSIAPPAEADGHTAIAKAVVKPSVTQVCMEIQPPTYLLTWFIHSSIHPFIHPQIQAPNDYDPSSLSAQLQQLPPSDTVLEFNLLLTHPPTHPPLLFPNRFRLPMTTTLPPSLPSSNSSFPLIRCLNLTSYGSCSWWEESRKMTL